MLKLRPADYDEIRRHGEETYPHECCGVLLGVIGDDWREVRATVRCGNTRIDFQEAHWIGCSYVITSVEHGRAEQTNSFALTGATEEDKALVDEPIVVE